MTTQVPASMTVEGVTAAQVTALQGRATALETRATTLEGLQLTSGTAQVTTSGTAIDFTGIPSTAKRITVMLASVSTSGSNNLRLQLGTGSGIETTSYAGASTSLVNAASPGVANLSAGFDGFDLTAAAALYHGSFVLTHIGSNVWSCSAVLGRSDTTRQTLIAGTKALAGVLDRIRLTTVGSTDTFDAGSMNILWE